MTLADLENKKILLLGFGVEGKATKEFLEHMFPNAVIGIADKAQDENYLEKQKDYDVAIKSPGVHPSLVTIPYTTATNLFFENVKGVTIGVTGSKGKSTASSLIYAILKKAGKKAHLVGNITHKLSDIGAPMLTELVKSNTPDDFWVCELSSFMLTDINFSPHISVFTSFFPEHLDYHKNLEEYWESKAKIIAQAKPTDYFVYNPEFEELKELAKESKAQNVPIVQDLPFDENNISLIGEHNKSNVKAAVTVGKILNIPDNTIANAIKEFKPLPHRLEKVGTFNSIAFYDDAISTTPQSAIQAINALGNVGTIFLGGQDRNFNFEQLAKTIIDAGIQNLVLFPETGGKIFAEIQKISQEQFTILETRDMQEAVAFAYKVTPSGTSCLLSTASPSFTVWKNFEEKGNLFKKIVRELGENTTPQE